MVVNIFDFTIVNLFSRFHRLIRKVPRPRRPSQLGSGTKRKRRKSQVTLFRVILSGWHFSGWQFSGWHTKMKGEGVREIWHKTPVYANLKKRIQLTNVYYHWNFVQKPWFSTTPRIFASILTTPCIINPSTLRKSDEK